MKTQDKRIKRLKKSNLFLFDRHNHNKTFVLRRKRSSNMTYNQT